MKVQVMTIQTVQKSSKSELSSRGKGPFKVFVILRFWLFFCKHRYLQKWKYLTPEYLMWNIMEAFIREMYSKLPSVAKINGKNKKLWTDVYPSRIAPILTILGQNWSQWPELSF